MILKLVHRFIKHERLRDAFGDVCAMVQRLAGLFDPVARRDAVQDLHGGRRLPGAVDFEGHALAVRKCCRDGSDAGESHA
ncbi:MAG: hypothetical protein VXX27_03065 [Pseudomonadota bacterium]|nr:hypothetical protein [Pseudomonadota bacterium]